jgi:hypothetical protein
VLQTEALCHYSFASFFYTLPYGTVPYCSVRPRLAGQQHAFRRCCCTRYVFCVAIAANTLVGMWSLVRCCLQALGGFDSYLLWL